MMDTEYRNLLNERFKQCREVYFVVKNWYEIFVLKLSGLQNIKYIGVLY